MKATTAWSKLGPRTGRVKLRACQMTVEKAVGVAPQSHPQLSSCVRLADRAEKLSLRSVNAAYSEHSQHQQDEKRRRKAAKEEASLKSLHFAQWAMKDVVKRSVLVTLM